MTYMYNVETDVNINKLFSNELSLSPANFHIKHDEKGFYIIFREKYRAWERNVFRTFFYPFVPLELCSHPFCRSRSSVLWRQGVTCVHGLIGLHWSQPLTAQQLIYTDPEKV